MPHFADAVYEYGGAPVGTRLPIGVGGRHFFVSVAAYGASDGNDGLTPETAVLSIYMALSKCVSGRRDVIRVLNYASANEVAWPIAVDKVGVSIIAEQGGGLQPRYTNGSIIDSTGNTDCMHMDVSHVRVQGFEFRAGTSCAGIKFDTSGVSRHGIFNCVFQSGKYGVWASANSMPSVGLHVKGCYFEESLVTNGILYHTDGPFFRFEDNVFLAVPAQAILVTGNAVAGAILNNYFGLYADTKGYAITISGINAYRSVIAGNQANYRAASMSTNPYLDTSGGAGGGNAWCNNYKAITAILPATS